MKFGQNDPTGNLLTLTPSYNDQEEYLSLKQYTSWDKLQEYPAGHGKSDFKHFQMMTKLRSIDEHILGPGWSSGSWDGLSLKIANIDAAIDLSGGRRPGRISIITPIEPTYPLPILHLGMRGAGNDYWQHRFPSARIYPLAEERDKLDISLVSEQLPFKVQKAIGSPEILISSLHLKSKEDLLSAIRPAYSALAANGSAIWRLDGKLINELPPILTQLTTIFEQTGLIRPACSPYEEIWIWAKGRADNKYLASARLKSEWEPSDEQVEYWRSFVEEWSQSPRHLTADLLVRYKANYLWLI